MSDLPLDVSWQETSESGPASRQGLRLAAAILASISHWSSEEEVEANVSMPRRSRPPAPRRSWAVGQRMLLNLVALAVLIGIFSLLSDKFLTPDDIANVLGKIAPVVTVGCFFTLLMVAGGIDLSVGGVLGISGMISVLLSNNGVPLPLAFAAAVTVGALVGSFNGLLVSVVGINTVIATLGTMYLTRGAALVLNNGKGIIANAPGFAWIGNDVIGPVPVLVVIMAVIVAIAVVLERRTAVGRYAMLVGSNPVGARLSGLPVRTVQVTLFVLTGAAAGLAGVMTASRFNNGLPHQGEGFEFDVLIATLLGGTSLLGGEGSVLGVMLGALIVGTVTTGMNITFVPSFIQTVLLGGVLILAVGFDAVARSRRNRSTRRVPAPTVSV